MSEWMPIGSTEIWTAKILGQSSVGTDDFCCWGQFAFITLVLVQPLPSPASHVVSSSRGSGQKPWPFPRYSEDSRESSMAHTGPCTSQYTKFWRQPEHRTFFTVLFPSLVAELNKQKYARGEEKEEAKSKWSSPVRRVSSWAWALHAEAIWRGHDWSLSSSFPDWKTEDSPERQPYSVAQFRCTPWFSGPVS